MCKSGARAMRGTLRQETCLPGLLGMALVLHAVMLMLLGSLISALADWSRGSIMHLGPCHSPSSCPL